MKASVDVLIVGAGPAGLALACDLQRRGVSHRIVSALEGGFEGSRAKGVQSRTLEVLDDLGVLSHLEPHASLYPSSACISDRSPCPRPVIKVHEISDDVPHPNTMLAAQYSTDAAFRARLRDLGGDVEFAARLTGFDEGPGGVVAHPEGPAGTEDVLARFLIGADGGGSTVRRTAGIDLDGTTDENDRMIVAEVTLTRVSRKYWHVWPRNGGRFMSLCPLPGGDKFQLSRKLRPEEKSDLASDAVDHLVTEFVGRAKIEILHIHWASVWRPNIRLAARYRQGPGFLVGDAAHCTHPPEPKA